MNEKNEYCDQISKCSDELMCVCPAYKGSCQYADHIQNGINFMESRFEKGPYLFHEDRIYYIGAATNNGSFRLNEEKQILLERMGLTLTPFLLENTVIESGTTDNPCDCKVVLTVDEENYTIMNANSRLLQRGSAEYILTVLEEQGHTVRILQTQQARTSSSRPAPKKTKSSSPPPVKASLMDNIDTTSDAPGGAQTTSLGITDEKPTPKAIGGQVNLFDIF